jgi:hypothetical protein
MPHMWTAATQQCQIKHAWSICLPCIHALHIYTMKVTPGVQVQQQQQLLWASKRMQEDSTIPTCRAHKTRPSTVPAALTNIVIACWLQ